MRRFVITTSYSIEFPHDVIRITPPAAGMIRVVEAHLTFYGTPLATQTRAPVILYQAQTDGAGTAVTPECLDTIGDVFPGSAARRLTSTATKIGQGIMRQHVDMRFGFHYTPAKEHRPVFAFPVRCVLRLGANIGTPLGIHSTLVFESEG